MRRTLIALFLCAFIQSIFVAPIAHANQCVMNTLRDAKNIGRNQSALRQLCQSRFDEWIARRPVSKRWDSMSATRREQQKHYACQVIVSVSSQLAKYADAHIVWKGGTNAISTLNGETTSFRVVMNGCKIQDICITGQPCLSRLIGDYEALKKKN
jgi:hypothetical protein